MIARLCPLLARWVSEARAAQQDALRELQALDAAVQQHMAHGAMAGNDPLTDSVYGVIDAACAAEGAVPPVTTGAGLTPEQLERLVTSQADDWWLSLVMPACVAVCAVLAAAKQLGWI